MQKPMVFLKLFIDFWILTFPGFRQLKTAQDTSNIAPRELQNERRSVQDGLKKAQEGA